MNIIEAARGLLGEQVQVGMGGDVIAEGQLLEVGEDGGYVIADDNGVKHYCWPMLSIESVESAKS